MWYEPFQFLLGGGTWSPKVDLSEDILSSFFLSECGIQLPGAEGGGGGGGGRGGDFGPIHYKKSLLTVSMIIFN